MQILSQRYFGNPLHWQQVFEWEDVFSSRCGIPIVSDVWGGYYLGALKRKFPALGRMVKTRKPSFQFTMTAHLAGEECLPNIVPCIIDYLTREPDGVRRFCRNFSRNPLTLISSREAYEFLKAQNVPLQIRHFPLSIADRYRITPDTRFEKKFDLALIGRGNRVLREFLTRYRQKHSDLSIISGPPRDRDGYMQYIRSARAMLYTTPGIDGARSDANGFNQVTPRFLEAVVGGCHVIARYATNPDTEFFELPTICPHTTTYEMFEEQLDRARRVSVDMKHYARYLEKHYTSTRIPLFNRYLAEAESIMRR